MTDLQVGNTVTMKDPGSDGSPLRGRINDLTETHAYVLWDGWALARWVPVSELTVDPWLSEAARELRELHVNNSEHKSR